MGIYVNPSNIGFKEILSADIYVDKTMLISELNKFLDKSKLLFVGINYDEKKKHTCEIEEVEK